MANETAEDEGGGAIGTRHDRRRFIVGAAAATVAVAAGGVGGYRLLSDNPPRKVSRRLAADELEYGTMRPMVGQRLALAAATGTVAANVATVSEPSRYVGGGVSGSSFSVFVESTEQLDQGTYEFTHDGTGTFPMFIVPVDMPTGDSYTYEAVFNRLA